MFTKTNSNKPWYDAPRNLMKAQLGDAADRFTTSQLRTAVEVQLGLRFMEYLQLWDEPIITLPSLLTLHDLPAFQRFSEEQLTRMAWMRYRLLDFIGRQRWQDSLRSYAQLPEGARLYCVDSERSFDMQLLREVMCEPYPDERAFKSYDDSLHSRPPYQRGKFKPALSGRQHYFFAYAGDTRHHVTVKIPDELTAPAPAWTRAVHDVTSDTLVDQYARSRQLPERPPRNYSWELLRDEVFNHMGQTEQENAGWRRRFANMSLTPVDDEGNLSNSDNPTLRFDGNLHLAGSVGSGKSTLVKIICHHHARQDDGVRIAVLVPSTNDAIELANEINQLLACDWNAPKAVAYFGWTNRDKYAAAFQNAHGDDPDHFGHRWISTTCGLLGMLTEGQIRDLNQSPLPGNEPCEKLSDEPLVQETEENKRKSQPDMDKTCPFYQHCPSHQKLRDLEHAQIIVTTAGALQSRLPGFFDLRRILLADYIYETCHVVFVDEADEVQSFVDNQYVNLFPLWRMSGALFSTADGPTSDAMRYRNLPEGEKNWSVSERDGLGYVLSLLELLTSSGKAEELRRWLGRSYFSSYRLFQGLARRMVGLPDWIALEDMGERREQYQFLSDVFTLLVLQDWTRIPDPDVDDSAKVASFGHPDVVQFAYKYANLLLRSSANTINDFVEPVKNLTLRMLTYQKIDVSQSIEQLNEALRLDAEEREYTYFPESIDTLVSKLMLALQSAGIDREIRMMVYNWHYQPGTVSSVIDIREFQPQFSTKHLSLPLAYTGAIFGTYYVPDNRPTDNERDSSNRPGRESLARLEYVNPGRELLLRFHRLYQRMGVHGPHVVYLSGTSYLPDSTRWHLRPPVKAILNANPVWRKNIEDHSHFAFTPAKDDSGKPIAVSGRSGKDGDYQTPKFEALREIAGYWGQEGTLEAELQTLQMLETEEQQAIQALPSQEERNLYHKLWMDRQRILIFVNSYDQADELASAIIDNTSFTQHDVKALKRTGDDDVLEGIQRAEVERVAESGLKILVAPLAAIGRGHNILSLDRERAAFGSVYFCVRPLMPPGDVTGIAAEVNHNAPRWLSDPHGSIAAKQLIAEQENELRRKSLELWYLGERRTYYKHLEPGERHDLGATTLGRFIQAAGRLVRGGVPMRVFFVDGAWAPKSAKRIAGGPRKNEETTKTSLLLEMICRLEQYISDDDKVGQALYLPFKGLLTTKNLYFRKDGICDDE
jgi:hypothetical protein